MWPWREKRVSKTADEVANKSASTQPTRFITPRMSGRLRSAVITSLRDAAADGEVWNGAAVKDLLGGSDGANYAVNNASLISAWTHDLREEASQRLLAGSRLILPSDVLAEAVSGATSTTHRGFRIADVTLVGDVDVGFSFACPDPPQGTTLKERIEWHNNTCDILIDGHIPQREANKTIDQLDIRHLILPGLEFCRCTLKGGLFAAGTTFKGDLVIDQCVLDFLFLRAAQIMGNLIIRDSRLIGLPPQSKIFNCDPPDNDPAFDSVAALTAIDARITASAYLVDSLFLEGADLDRIRIEGSLFCYGSHFRYYQTHYDIAALSLDSASIGGSVWLSGEGSLQHPGSKDTNDLDRDPTKPGSTGRSRRRLFCAIGGVNMRNAEIKGTLNCSGAILMPYTYVHQSELLSQMKEPEEARKRAKDWRFHGDVYALDMSLRCAGITVGHDVNLNDRFTAVGIVDFSSASVSRQFNFRPSLWDGKFEFWGEPNKPPMLGNGRTRMGREDWAKVARQNWPSWYLDLEDSSIDDTLRINLSRKAHADTETMHLDPKPATSGPEPLRYHRAVVDLRNVKCPVYSDDFDASNKLLGDLSAPNIQIRAVHNWPRELSLQLGGFEYDKIRIDEKAKNREDRRGYYTRDSWLTLQYQNVEVDAHWNKFHYYFIRKIHRFPIVGWAWRLSLLCLAGLGEIVRQFAKLPLIGRIIAWVRSWFAHPTDPQRSSIKVDWQPREWRQFQPEPWLRCAETLKRAGQQNDARKLLRQRERHGLLHAGSDQVDKTLRHSLLVLSGHGYRRRFLLLWGFAAGFLMWLNYQIAFEIGLVKPMEAEVHVSQYHLDTNLSPPSQIEANTIFLALEKVTPGLNFFLEENWSACDATQIRKAETFARCVINTTATYDGNVDAALGDCHGRLGKELPPLACLPRHVYFPTPCYVDDRNCFSLHRAPPDAVLKYDDCLALGEGHIASCYIERDLIEQSPTAKWWRAALFNPIASVIKWITFGVVDLDATKLLNAYYLGGGARIGSWLLMLFGWLLVGIGAASLSGLLRRDD